MTDKLFKEMNKFFIEVIQTTGLEGIYEKDLIIKFINFATKNEDVLLLNINTSDKLELFLEAACFSQGVSLLITEKHLPKDLIDKCFLKFKAYYFY